LPNNGVLGFACWFRLVLSSWIQEHILPDFFRLSSLLSLSDARLLWFFCPCLGDCLSVSLLLRCTLTWLRSVNATSGFWSIGKLDSCLAWHDFVLSMPLLASGLLFSTREGG
jgi:hypothetical protein